MSGGFGVELKQLGELITKLNDASEKITAASNVLRDAGGHDLGSEGIDRAAKNFQEKWSDGIGKVSRAAGATSEALQGAKKTYEDVEHAVEEAFQQGDRLGPRSRQSALQRPIQQGQDDGVPQGNSRIENRLNG